MAKRRTTMTLREVVEYLTPLLEDPNMVGILATLTIHLADGSYVVSPNRRASKSKRTTPARSIPATKETT